MITINFDTWSKSSSWPSFYFFTLHIKRLRIYNRRHEPTIFARVTKFEIWKGTEEDKENA